MVEDKQGKPEDESPTTSPEEQQAENASESAIEEAPVDHLAVAQAQAEDYLRSWRRTQADFVNFKRRTEQERGELEQMAAAEVMRSLLPVLDDFDRALAALSDENGAEGTWASGIVQIVRKLQTVLKQHGLEAMDVIGEDFDPAKHDAVLQVDVPPEEVGKVTAEARRGYRLKGRVLRPAQVVVGKAAE